MKNKETLEEVAENYADKQSDISMRQNPLEYSKSGEELWYESKVDFIEGAKWQAERMYSEEEVRQIINSFEKLCYNYQSNKDWFPSKKSEWFEQFKNK